MRGDNEMLLKDKVALVTGAGRGIGYHIAIEMLKEGAKVVVVDLATDQWNSDTMEGTFQKDKDFFVYQLDITDSESVRSLVRDVFDELGRIDILVNNAGINRDSLFVKMTEKDWDDVLNVNLRAPFILTQATCQEMIKANIEGRVINIVSTAGKHGNFGQANYSAAKAGLLAFTKSVAREMARYGIRVNAVMPGLIDTPMARSLRADILEKKINEIPLKRVGHPKEVARAVIFLSSDDASYITGACLQVDGGLRM